MRPIGVDLFSGVGGLSLGFERAGFDVVAAVEIDPVHAAAHKFNFPDCTVIPESVAHLSGDEIRRRAKLGGRRIDVVFGGAPCQGFSLIGHRAFDDPRNSLVKHFVRLVSELDASYFVFENVKGLTVGRHKTFLKEIVEEFERCGYEVRLPWRVLNASSYGVPQQRERLILVGAKNGLKLPAYPAARTYPANGEAIDGLSKGPSCRDALEDLPDLEMFESLWSTDAVRTAGWGPPSVYAAKMRGVANDAFAFGYPRDWDPLLLTSSARTDHTEISRRRFAETAPGSVEPISRFFKLSGDGLSNTLRAGTDGARGAFTSPRPIHYKYPRCISVREMARLHGFPDWFRLHETKWHGAREIGNAVPPPLAEAVAAEVLLALNVAPIRPGRVVALGDTELLRLTVNQAATRFGVFAPLARRDQKSGARKRSQAQTEAARLAAAE
jgi:DNA (cytosine-5)-methyltransferase 1